MATPDAPSISPACARGQAWKELAPVPISSSQIFQLSRWLGGGEGTLQSIGAYVRDHLLIGMWPSIALTGLMLVTFLAFLLWRLLAMCLGSDHSTQKGKLRKQTDRKLMSYKAAVLFCASAVLVPVIAGMVLLPVHPLTCVRQESNAAFSHAQGVLDKGRQMWLAFQEVLHTLKDFEAKLDKLDPEDRADIVEAIDQPRRHLVNALESAHNAVEDVEAEIEQGMTDYNVKFLDDAEAQLSNAVKATDGALSTADEYWSAAYAGWQGGYALLILLLIVAVATACFSRGMAASSGLLQAWLVVWLLLAALVLGAMVFMNDACEHAERVLLEQVQDLTDLHAVPRYYFYGDNTLKEAIQEDGLLDVDKVQAEIDKSQDFVTDVEDQLVDLVTDIKKDVEQQVPPQQKIPPQREVPNESAIPPQKAVPPQRSLRSAVPPATNKTVDDALDRGDALKQELRSAIGSVNKSVDDAQEQLSVLLEAAEREPVVALYKRLKACVCCTLGTQLFTQWLCVTISALMAYLAVLSMVMALGRLDGLHSRDSGSGAKCDQQPQEPPVPSPSFCRPSIWPKMGKKSSFTSLSALHGTIRSRSASISDKDHSIFIPSLYAAPPNNTPPPPRKERGKGKSIAAATDIAQPAEIRGEEETSAPHRDPPKS